jgi:hypothetical protein
MEAQNRHTLSIIKHLISRVDEMEQELRQLEHERQEEEEERRLQQQRRGMFGGFFGPKAL